MYLENALWFFQSEWEPWTSYFQPYKLTRNPLFDPWGGPSAECPSTRHKSWIRQCTSTINIRATARISLSERPDVLPP